MHRRTGTNGASPRQIFTPGFSARCDLTVKRKSPSSVTALCNEATMAYNNCGTVCRARGCTSCHDGSSLSPATTKSEDSFPRDISQLWWPVSRGGYSVQVAGGPTTAVWLLPQKFVSMLVKGLSLRVDLSQAGSRNLAARSWKTKAMT
jgi:hypothetical protein